MAWSLVGHGGSRGVPRGGPRGGSRGGQVSWSLVEHGVPRLLAGHRLQLPSLHTWLRALPGEDSAGIPDMPKKDVLLVWTERRSNGCHHKITHCSSPKVGLN